MNAGTTISDLYAMVENCPDPYLLLGSAKMHLANRVMEVGDIHAWWLLDDRMDILMVTELIAAAHKDGKK